MTEDFKSKILKYLTGNLEQETGTNEPQFEPAQIITNNLYQHMIDNYDVEGQMAPYIIDIIKSNASDTYLCYGNGYKFGFMIILDSNFQIVQSTKQYTSGTEMHRFYYLKQGSDGKFFGVDYTESGNNNYKRFLILNNVLLKNNQQTEYQFVMRRTYNFPSSYSSISSFTTINDVIKNENGNSYLICGNYMNENYNYNCIALEFVINVGSTNEWKEYKQTASDGKDYSYDGGWCSWNSEGNISILIACSDNNVVYILNNSNNTLNISTQFNISTDTNITIFKTVILNSTTFYTIAKYYDNQNDDGKTYIYMIKNGVIQLIYESPIYTTVVGNIVTCGLKTDYVNTYFWYLTKDETQYSYYGGLILKDNVYSTLIQTVDDIYALSLQLSFNQFNLYTFTLQSSNTLYKISFVFNQFNYNGLEYENTNSMIPNSAILLEDSDDPDIIFARNLYNLNINNNTTVSTVEIPNTFLNDTTIAGKELWSQTNTILTFDITPITKNIYEVLHINFFNTLLMKNSNNPNNEILNNLGATRLNQSISSTNDYTDTIANKIRINYDDGISIVQKIGTPTITNNVATYTITIYVPKEITNIEIISNDENTSYQTITGTFDINKYYTLTQDVRVE